MQSNIAPEGMVVTPHHLATQTAVSILKEGGTAMDAMVAAAATIAVVYPHMNSIGGDGFWLIVPPYGEPIVIEACGGAGSLATKEFFKTLKTIPYKGPKAAVTVAGTVGGWEEVLNYVKECGYPNISRARLLLDAIRYAENGFAMTEPLRNSLIGAVDSNTVTEDFAKVFLPDKKVPEIGDICRQKQLASTLRRLVENEFNSFYKGDVGKDILEDMTALGLPITESDLKNYAPIRKCPLRLSHNLGEIYNLPPPTQGLVSLLIHGILENLNIDGKHEGQFIHATVEATKQAFEVRNKVVTDPQYMTVNPEDFLSCKAVSNLASKINFEHTSSVGKGTGPGDTIWMGAMDRMGYSVGFIQSIYHEFGSGVLLPKTGILWHNRGVAFNLENNHILSVKPGKKPLHTLIIGAAKMKDGRVMVYGTRGGDGQPQTQATIFHRYAVQNMNLQAAISAPRWIYGRNNGDHEDDLKLESRYDDKIIQYLKERGHKIVMLPDYSERVGQAGALVRHPNGMMEGAFDPRSNGSAAGY